MTTPPVTTLTMQASVTKPPRVIGDYQGERNGPTLIVIGGIHGNEPAGLIAAQRILDRLDDEKPGAFAGRIVALAGNLTALADEDPHLRYIETDLNRMWTPEMVHEARIIPENERSAEQREQLELLDVIETERAGAKGPVYVLDMHSVSSESPPFVFVEDSLPARRLAMRFEIPIILGFEEELRGLLVDYCTNTLGLTSLLIEGGVHEDPETADALEHAIRIALDAIGAWPVDSAYDTPCPNAALDSFARGHGRLVYDVRFRHPILHEHFQVDPKLHAFDPVRREQTVVAIDGQQPITAPLNGLLFMPNRQPRAFPGDDGFFVVRRVGYLWLRLSATIRSMGVLHRVVPMLAPGVSRHPDFPHRLLIDPDLAAALKREVFHLLGYRILKQGESQSMSKRRRLLQATFAATKAAMSAVFNRIRGRHVPLIDREDAWVVGRRRLDIQSLRHTP